MKCENCSGEAEFQCSACAVHFFCGEKCWASHPHQWKCVGLQARQDSKFLNGMYVDTYHYPNGVPSVTELRELIDTERAFPRMPNGQELGMPVALWYKCIEDIYAHDYTDAFFLFWTGHTKAYILGFARDFVGGKLDFWIEYGKMYPNSFPLLKYQAWYNRTDLVYSDSKRPVTLMVRYFQDRYWEEQELECTEEGYTYLPVTRYSPSRLAGLYAPQHVDMGTFYYHEPQSECVLRVQSERLRTFVTKQEAFVKLIGEAELRQKKVLTPFAPADPLLYSAREFMAMEIRPREYTDEDRERDALHFERMTGAEKDTKCYVAFKFKLYAYSDSLDAPLMRAAREQDVDVLVFEREVGSRQRVKEIFDTRNREISFDNLFLMKDDGSSC